MSDGTGLAEALLGLDGLRVLEVTESDVEVVIDIETPEDIVGLRFSTPCSPDSRRPWEWAP